MILYYGLLNAGEIEMRKGTDIYKLSRNESSEEQGRFILEGWDFGRLHNVPLWTEFVAFYHYPANWFFVHHNPPQTCFEIPIHGRLKITHRDRQLVLKPGEVYLLPAGEYNRLETDRKSYCSKWSMGICGNLLEMLLPELFREHLHFFVRDLNPVLAPVKEIQDLMHEKKPASVPRIAALSLQFLMALVQETPVDIPPPVAEMIRIFEFNAGKPVGIRQVATELKLPQARLVAMFKSHFGVTPMRYQIELRRKRAERLLRETLLPVKEIAMRLGYGAPQFFTREFSKVYGCSPRTFRNRQRQGKGK